MGGALRCSALAPPAAGSAHRRLHGDVTSGVAEILLLASEPGERRPPRGARGAPPGPGAQRRGLNREKEAENRITVGRLWGTAWSQTSRCLLWVSGAPPPPSPACHALPSSSPSSPLPSLLLPVLSALSLSYLLVHQRSASSDGGCSALIGFLWSSFPPVFCLFYLQQEQRRSLRGSLSLIPSLDH